MGNYLVKILSDDDGELIEKQNQLWHYVVNKSGGEMTLCKGEFFGFGESACKFRIKVVERGGITCPHCLSQIKQIKSIKL